MLMLYAGLTLAVAGLAGSIAVYLYATRKATRQVATQHEHERRRRAVISDFGDGAVWQMGQQATNPIGNEVPVSPVATRRGFLPRMAISLLISVAGRREAAAVLGLLLSDASPAQSNNDSVTYQGVRLQPGDVINFLGGGATTGGLLTYGHTGLYLGIDPQTRQQTFLDFSTTKGGPIELVFGTARAFRGRILSEREFLDYNGRYHQGFDVFRLRDASTINQRVMIREAKRIAATESWGPLTQVCSSAVAVVLSRATGTVIDVTTPDGFTAGRFGKHPQLAGKSINIQVALREVIDRDRRQHVDTPHGDSG